MNFFLCLILSSLALATGAPNGREGGGGGGIKINGKVYTLAEMGLRLENPETPYFPDAQVVAATSLVIEKVNSILPRAYQKLLPAAVFGNGHTYQKVKVEWPELFERFQEEYAKYTNGLSLHGDFVLAAYTEEHVTYLFPDFFRAFPETQAIYLLHESAFHLNSKASLENVLRWEIALVDFLRGRSEMSRRVAVYDSLASLGFLGKTPELNQHIANALYLRDLLASGQELDLSYFLPENQILADTKCPHLPLDLDSRLEKNVYVTDGIVLSQHRALEPSFFRRFYKTYLYTKEITPITGLYDYLGCGMEDRRAENFALVVREDEASGRPKILAVPKNPSPWKQKDRRETEISFFVDLYLYPDGDPAESGR